MDGGYDLTKRFMKDDKKSGLFAMFEQVCPEDSRDVVKDVKSRMEVWDKKGRYGVDQIKYAALDAIVSLMAGVGGWRELDGPNWKSFDLSPIPPARLDLLVLVVVMKKRIDQVSFDFLIYLPT
jgi:DMSO/TMAO reductase YedYZ molybdopterin-dependent catalytic subunit